MAVGRCGPTGEAAAAVPRLRPDMAGGRPWAEGVEALALLDKSRRRLRGNATEKRWWPTKWGGPAPLRGGSGGPPPRGGSGPATATLPRAPLPPAAEPLRPHLSYFVSFPIHGRLPFDNRSVQGVDGHANHVPVGSPLPSCRSPPRCSCVRRLRPTATSCSLLSPPPLTPASHLSLRSLPRQSPQSTHSPSPTPDGAAARP